jgi:hypothetical protein
MTTRIARCARRALLSFALVAPAMFTATAALAEILVVAPHPDGDILMAAGVAYRAVDVRDWAAFGLGSLCTWDTPELRRASSKWGPRDA